MVISSLIGLFLILVIGLLSGNFIESVIFYTVFCSTRMFCGGFHAHSHLLCKATFVGAFILVIVIDLVLNNIESFYWFIIYIYCLIIVCAFAPVENSNKTLTTNDVKRCKSISFILMMIWLTVMFLLYIFGSELYHIVALTLFFIANLMLLGKQSEGRKSR